MSKRHWSGCLACPFTSACRTLQTLMPTLSMSRFFVREADDPGVPDRNADLKGLRTAEPGECDLPRPLYRDAKQSTALARLAS